MSGIHGCSSDFLAVRVDGRPPVPPPVGSRPLPASCSSTPPTPDDGEAYGRGDDPRRDRAEAIERRVAVMQELAARYEAAYNERDPAAVAALYEPDARWMAAAGAVFGGRSAIESALTVFMASVAPDLSLHELARVESGRHAVSRGTYGLSDAAGAARSIGGAYLNVLRRGDDGWRILRQQMNYDVEMTPDMWVGDRAALEDGPEGGTLVAQLGFTSRDVGLAGGSDAWTPDAQVALPGLGWVTGPPVIRRSLRDGSPWQPDVVMHDLETLRLDGGLAVDVGWYELGPPGPGSRWGTYTLLARAVPRGEWLVHWLVATASPARAS